MMRGKLRLTNTVGLLLATCALLPRPLAAQNLDLKSGDKLDILDELSGSKTGKSDTSALKFSHLSLLENWPQVQPVRLKPGTSVEKFRWKMGKGFASPLGPSAISTQIAVPAAGEYRLLLRERLGAKLEYPVTLTLEPVAGGAAQTHTFGKLRLLDNRTGKEQEKALPIIIESEVQLNTFPDSEMFVWEYWDVKLSPGAYRVSLASGNLQVKVEALFLSQSKSFRPSFSTVKKDNTLSPVYMRVRPAKAGSSAPTYSLTAGLTYHWRGRNIPGTAEPMWGYPIGTAAKIPAKSWSPFIDASEAMTPGPGLWSTCRLSMAGVTSGEVDIEFGWYPEEIGVVHRVTTAVNDGRAMLRVPHGSPFVRADHAEPVWGMWDPAYVAGFQAEEQVVERYFTWADAARKKLNLPPDHPAPKHVKLLCGCRTGAGARDRAATMLATLGVNWIPDASESVVKQFGLYVDKPVSKFKIGDEISTYTEPAIINADGALLAAFHDYLISEAKRQGTSLRDLLGVDDPAGLLCLDVLPEGAGRFERRLYYHSQRYAHLATIAYYDRATRAIEKKNPGAHVYNNYSPHPVFLTGRNMNGADWFLLPRAGAQTLGWAEDWATGGSWGLGTPSAQCTTFYAALVECAVRKRGYPSGFYAGVNCGYGAQKIASCVSQGISILHLYDWGPIDGWAEGSNAWSELESQYEQVMIGAHALGPADEIIGQGKREPRRTAILYNRSHEIASGDLVTLNHDWMWTFLALKSAQIPVDVIIEEDLNDDDLKQYEVLYLGGRNLDRQHLAAVRRWVENGGLVVGSVGSAECDPYNDPLAESAELFGAQQTCASPDDKTSRAAATFVASDWFPAGEIKAFAPLERKYFLQPTTAKSLATYDGGPCAATVNPIGKGNAILLGFAAGETFRQNGKALGTAREWLIAPVLHRLGRQRVEFSHPESEATLWEHASGLAVLLANFTPQRDTLPTTPGKLSVQTERPIKEVMSGLRGPLKWRRQGERIEIETPSPAELVVDTVILR